MSPVRPRPDETDPGCPQPPMPPSLKPLRKTPRFPRASKHWGALGEGRDWGRIRPGTAFVPLKAGSGRRTAARSRDQGLGRPGLPLEAERLAPEPYRGEDRNLEPRALLTDAPVKFPCGQNPLGLVQHPER